MHLCFISVHKGLDKNLLTDTLVKYKIGLPKDQEQNTLKYLGKHVKRLMGALYLYRYESKTNIAPPKIAAERNELIYIKI